MEQHIDRSAEIAPESSAVSLGDRYALTLLDGLTVGQSVFFAVTLRDLTAKDLMDAQDASEKVVRGEDGVSLVSSPSRMGMELLRRQVLRLTEGDMTHNGPLSLTELGRLSVRDLALLQQAADALDVFSALQARAAAQGGEARGRNSGGDV